MALHGNNSSKNNRCDRCPHCQLERTTKQLLQKLTTSNSSPSSSNYSSNSGSNSNSSIASKTNEYLMNAAAMMGAASNAAGGGCTGGNASISMSGSVLPQQPPNLPYSGLTTSAASPVNNSGGDVNVSINMLLNWLHSSHDKPAAQTEALWALTNVAGLAPPNVCAGLSGSAAAAAAAVGGCDPGSVAGGSLTPQLQALLQQQQAQLQQYQQSLAAMSAAASSLSNSAMSNMLQQNELAMNSAFGDAYKQGDKSSVALAADMAAALASEHGGDIGDEDDPYAHDGNVNSSPMVNNAALSNFLEQAALSGVNLDPSTLAAAVQLCTTTAAPCSTSMASSAGAGMTPSGNHSPHVAAMMNWTGTASTNLPPQDNASAGSGGSNSANASGNNFSVTSASGSSAVGASSTGYNPSQLSSTLAAAISASGGVSPPSYSNSAGSVNNNNSTLIQTLSTAANLTNSFGGGTGGSNTASVATNLMNTGASSSTYSSSNSNVLLTHADAIPTLISLLKSPHRQVHEQAMWILGSIVVGTTHSNMNAVYGAAAAANSSSDGSSTNPPPSPSTSSNQAAASAAAREAVLAAGILEPLCSCLNENAWNISLQRIGSWLLSNLVIPTNNSSNSSGSNTNNDGDKDGNDDTSNTGDVSIMDDVSSSNGGGSGGKGGSKKDRNKNDITSDGGPNSGNVPSALDVDAILPTLRRLLFSGDADVLSHTCWALSHLCDGPSSHIAAVVCDSGGDGGSPDMGYGTGAVTIPQRLVELLLHPSWRVTKPALRTIGNIVCAECTDANKDGSGNSGGDGSLSHSLVPKMPSAALQDYTEIVLQCGAVPHLKTLISHCNKEIQKEACWTLSNIAAGTISQIQAVMDCGAIPPLVVLASDADTDHEVRSEACWVVLNATSCGSDEQVEQLVADGCVNVLGVLLKEASMVMMALEGLERVLQVEEAREKGRALFDAAGGMPSYPKRMKEKEKKSNAPDFSSVGSVVNANLIESLEHHKNSAVAKRAQRIWKQHFVRCALCQQYYSRHRESEAKFCKECKCHVCSSCNCEVYHLSYQEELWAATEEKDQAGKASKSKKKKQKKKDKEKKKQQQVKPKETPPLAPKEEVVSISAESGLVSSCKNRKKKPGKNAAENNSSRKGASTLEDDSINHTSSVSSTTENGSLNSKPQQSNKKGANSQASAPAKSATASKKSATTMKLDQLVPSGIDTTSILEEDGDSIDFVLYLQQTGSIIALSKLMDALDYDKEEDEEVDLMHMNFASKEIAL